jgi:aspartate-semialdehyde dehydrogenase
MVTIEEHISRARADANRNRRYRVGILGATGTVGQRFIQLLEHHPQFKVTALAASDRSQGKRYAQACTWRLPGAMPEAVRFLVVEAPCPPLDCDFVFSSLPSQIARDTEDAFARAGYPVISNSSAYRMDEDVPLLIPEINHQHLALLSVQRGRGFKNGAFIVTNPNCSTIILALALAPLHARFGIASAAVTTMQALSGAGYPGVASHDIADNVLPFIEAEEEKIESETLKILGCLHQESIRSPSMSLSAQCHRVNVTDGHLAAIRVKLIHGTQLDEVRETLASFQSLPQEVKLHSAPDYPIIVRDEVDRPQPRLDRDTHGGMSVTVGRLARDQVLDYRFVALGHNTIRGAAGAAILNAELLIEKGYL